MPDSSQRTVKLKSSVKTENGGTHVGSGVQEVNLTFISMSTQKTPTAEDYGITNSAKATKLNNTLSQLASVNESFFQWLEADSKNAILFANDPLKAIKTAIPAFDEKILTDLTDVFK